MHVYLSYLSRSVYMESMFAGVTVDSVPRRNCPPRTLSASGKCLPGYCSPEQIVSPIVDSVPLNKVRR